MKSGYRRGVCGGFFLSLFRFNLTTIKAPANMSMIAMTINFSITIDE